jgi:CMP/dCMP kinase
LQKRIVVAIDGPAGAGKSTIARRVAERLGATYIDTGAMYRAVALWARESGVDWTDAQRLTELACQSQIAFEAGTRRVWLNGREVTGEIRSHEMSEGASKVSAVPGVRRALVAMQQAMGRDTSVVMEGRDIGTVVFPDADVKIFLDAASTERARRRCLDLKAAGAQFDERRILEDIESRDARDSTRSDSPLTKAVDAVVVDTSNLSIEEVEGTILDIVASRTHNGKEVSS